MMFSARVKGSGSYIPIRQQAAVTRKHHTPKKLATPWFFTKRYTLKAILQENGYAELLESGKWNLEQGKNYFVCRDAAVLLPHHHPARDGQGTVQPCAANHAAIPLGVQLGIVAADRHLRLFFQLEHRGVGMGGGNIEAVLNVITPVILTLLGIILPQIAKRERAGQKAVKS